MFWFGLCQRQLQTRLGNGALVLKAIAAPQRLFPRYPQGSSAEGKHPFGSISAGYALNMAEGMLRKQSRDGADRKLILGRDRSIVVYSCLSVPCNAWPERNDLIRTGPTPQLC